MPTGLPHESVRPSEGELVSGVRATGVQRASKEGRLRDGPAPEVVEVLLRVVALLEQRRALEQLAEPPKDDPCWLESG